MLYLLLLCLNVHVGTKHYCVIILFLCTYIGALHFVLKADDYGKGMHTVVVTVTDLLGGRANETLIFGMVV